jgi:amino acid adenylation domain-containing protein
MSSQHAAKIADLSPEQLQQIAKRLQNKRAANPSTHSLQGLRQPGIGLPLSYAQERLWVHEKMGLMGTAYHMGRALRLIGRLDAVALERACKELVRRHESLRTHFETIAGQDTQVIDSTDSFAIRHVAVDDVAHLANESVLQEFARQEMHRPFDLSQGPLFRVSLLQLSDTEHAMVLTMHHIISDGWSNGVLVRELKALYAAYCNGQASPLAELSAQYADYALWQRKTLESIELKRQLTYWKEQLSSAPLILDLPTDHKRPTAPSFKGGMCSIPLSKPLSQAVLQLARQEDATLFMVLLAAFQLLLSRWSGQPDIVVGTPTAGRGHPQTEGIIGFFVNTLAVRANLQRVENFSQLIRQVKDTVVSAFAHQDLPFDQLVKELAPQRDLSRQPIFQTMMVLQNVSVPEFQFGDLQVEGINSGNVSAKFDLTLMMQESEGCLLGAFEYATDLFDADTIASLAQRFERLLTLVTADPHAQIKHIDLLSESERTTILHDWSDATKSVPQWTLPQLFEHQAEHAPDAMAIEGRYIRQSYRELNARANQLAHFLIKQGIGPEDTIAIAIPRSIAMVVGVLAIVKAGAAYLPLDLNSPIERLDFMIKDAQPRYALTFREFSARLAPSIETIYLDDEDLIATLGMCNDDNPTDADRSRALQLLHPAYVIYTSGSTGKPKGVVVTHAGLSSLTASMAAHFQVNSDSRVAQLASIAFDAAMLEMLMAFGSTACLVLPEHGPLVGTELADFLEQQRISHLFAVPTVLATVTASKPTTLRMLAIGGEACSADLVAGWSEDRRMHNIYGPTEATIFSTQSDVLRMGAPFPIGRPVWNTKVYVLDEALQPVPPGVDGELYIAGNSLARGYLNRASLSASHFVANPFGAPGERMYRTGDRVRWMRDGNIEYIGRTDHQIKLRGLRIELGEIEARLLQHPDVAQVAVALRMDRSGNQQLVGYAVPRTECDIDTPLLRRFLAEQLPEHMIPATIVPMAALPFNQSGKLDRSALPEPPELVSTQGRDPRNPQETILCQLFAEALGLERVSIDDSFFDLGGDSIRCVHLASRARAAGLHIEPRDLFARRTAAGLAESLESRARSGSHVNHVAVNVRHTGGNVPLTPVQRIFLALWDDEIALNASTYLYGFARPIHADVVCRALELLVMRHDAFRLAFSKESGQWVQRLSTESVEANRLCKIVDLSTLDDAAITSRVDRETIEIPGRIQMDSGLMLQATLFVTEGNQAHKLLLHVHHFANDALSYPLIVEELQELCAKVEAQDQVDIKTDNTSFADWATMLSAHLAVISNSPETSQDIGSAELSLDFENGENTAASMRLIKSALNDAYKPITQISAIHRITPGDLIVVALALAIEKWNGSDVVPIEQLHHGRIPLHVDCALSRTIGWFTTGLPVVIDMRTSRDISALTNVFRKTGATHDLGGLSHWAKAASRLESGIESHPMTICQNHLGEMANHERQASSLLDRIPFPRKNEIFVTQKAKRPHVIELQTMFNDQTLEFAWRYSANLHHQSSIERLSACFRTTMTALFLSTENGQINITG